MTTVLEIEKKILACKTKAEVFLTEEEKTNLVLDKINDITKYINKVNIIYLKLFPLLDTLSSCEMIDDKDFNALKEIMLELGKLATRTSMVFAHLSKSDIIQNGCKSALNDLRANIRTLREYLEDVEETFLLEDKDAGMDTILSALI